MTNNNIRIEVVSFKVTENPKRTNVILRAVDYDGSYIIPAYITSGRFPQLFMSGCFLSPGIPWKYMQKLTTEISQKKIFKKVEENFLL